jgi:acetoin utilization deacetylase AcuC-like enzyme
LGERIRALRLPCLIVQEGGYHLESLEVNAQAFFAEQADWR